MDTLAFIMDYESGALDDPCAIIDGFAGLIKSGMAWQLQGSYGRAAASLIEGGYINENGEVLDYGDFA